MSELLRAAKAVIYHWNEFGAFKIRHHIPALRAAVERAGKHEAVGFDEWADNNMSAYGKECSRKAWQAAQQAERERCREIVITMGGPDVPDLLRQIDSGED